MQEITVKGQEIIKINGKRYVISSGNILTGNSLKIKELDKIAENDLCKVYLEKALIVELGIEPITIKRDKEGEAYFEIYSPDNEELRNRKFYIRNCRVVLDPSLYMFELARDVKDLKNRYILYADKEYITMLVLHKGGAISCYEIRENIIEGRIVK